MLLRIVLESLARQRRRKLVSVLAITLGIAVTAAVGTMALEVGDKINRELRSFGANLAMTPAADGLTVAVGGVDLRPAGAGAFLPESALGNLKKIFWRNNIVAFAPFLYVPATIADRHVVVIGTWFEKGLPVDKSEVFVTGLRKLHPAWQLTGQWPSDDSPQDVLVGSRLAARVGPKLGQMISLKQQVPEPSEGSGLPLKEALRSWRFGRSAELRSAAALISRPVSSGMTESTGWQKPCRSRTSADFIVRGILTTGGPEDDEVLAPLAAVQCWAGLEGKVRRVEISALTKPEDAFARADVARLSGAEFDRWYCSPYANSIAYQIEQAIPEAQVKPIYQVADTEGRILNRVRVLMALLVGAALVTAALAVASLMLATVMEQQAEIGLFKSLGATDTRVGTIFLAEACALGGLSGVAGYFLGSLLAWRLGLEAFGVAIGLHWVMLPACLGLALLVTLAGSALPLLRAMKVAPSVALRD